MSTLVALPETVRGLPLHALVLHATVVLVPLAAFGALLCAVWPAARRRFGGLVVLGTLVATVLVPITTGSGKNLSRQLGAAELVREHAQWGQRLLPTMIVLLLAVVALVGVDAARRSATTPLPGTPAPVGPAEAPPTASPAGGGRLSVMDRRLARTTPAALRSPVAADRLRVVLAVVALIAVVAAVVALVVVFQTGESGARAVWGGR
jgi:hypothetical protein